MGLIAELDFFLSLKILNDLIYRKSTEGCFLIIHRVFKVLLAEVLRQSITKYI